MSQQPAFPIRPGEPGTNKYISQAGWVLPQLEVLNCRVAPRPARLMKDCAKVRRSSCLFPQPGRTTRFRRLDFARRLRSERLALPVFPAGSTMTMTNRRWLPSIFEQRCPLWNVPDRYVPGNSSTKDCRLHGLRTHRRDLRRQLCRKPRPQLIVRPAASGCESCAVHPPAMCRLRAVRITLFQHRRPAKTCEVRRSRSAPS